MGKTLKNTPFLQCVVVVSVFMMTGGLAAPALAQKTNQPVYVDPFDRAAGAATLTRASKEGRIFANPALLPYGPGFHRWIGTTLAVSVNRESVDTSLELVQKSQAGGGDTGSAANSDSDAASSETSTLIDKAFANPIRFGSSAAVSWVTKHVGVSAFGSGEFDLRARQYGDAGLPEIRLRAESYNGAAVGTALRTPWRWLSLGLTAKYLLATERDETVDISDQAAVEEFAQGASSIGVNQGLGIDSGMLLFFQGKHVDLSLAGKVDDLGSTKLTGPENGLKELKQVASVGVGLAFHTGTDAIHLALDYRDIGNAYEEAAFKRIYAGTKILLRTYVGLAAGFYHGYPSLGVELDFIFFRLTAARYTRELGERPGVDPRHMYTVSLGMGF